jgi:hypothetical protein
LPQRLIFLTQSQALGWAEGYTLGSVAFAEIALVRFAGAVDILDHAEGAGADTGSTANAFDLVYCYDATCHVFSDGILRAGLLAPGVITLHTRYGDKLGFLDEDFIEDAGATGGELARILERTGQFTGLAANTFGRFDANQFLHELPPSQDV